MTGTTIPASWAVVVLASAIVFSGRLAWLYFQERAKNLAREQSDRALSNLRHEQERALAALSAEHGRRLQEFGLYAQKQHHVYATLYRWVRDAAASYFGLTSTILDADFSAYDEEDVAEFQKRHKLRDADVRRALTAAHAGQVGQTERLMEDLYFKVRRRDANRVFWKAKRVEAVYELYLSDPVRIRALTVRTKMARVSTLVGEIDYQPAIAYEAQRELDAAVSELFHTMRDEMRRGAADDHLPHATGSDAA